jgi:dipeptidyl-peptidase 4
MKFKLTLSLTIFLLSALSAHTQIQDKKISLDDIYKQYTFSSNRVSGINSMNDGIHYSVSKRGRSIEKHNYSKGEKIATLFNVKDFKDIAYFSDYEFNLDESNILLTTNIDYIYRHSFAADYYVLHTNDNSLHPLSINGKQQLATFSPDGELVTFFRDNNLFIANVEQGAEIQITFDGEQNKIINGAPDWVYEEEFAFSQGFYWSPDGNRIAYYRFDETEVPEFGMSIFGDLYPEPYKFKYPKAGEVNSNVTLHVYDLQSKKTIKVDVEAGNDSYIPRIKWTNDSDILSVTWLNRLQNHVKIIHCDAGTGTSEVVYEESNEKYISEATDNMITYLPDNKSFILISELSGYFHFYRYDFNKRELSAATKGEWDIHSLLGIDTKKKEIYYTSYEESSIERHVYAIKYDGSKKRKISKRQGSNNAYFSQSFEYYILSHSDANTPASYTLFNRKGELIRELETNEDLKKTTAEYGFSKVEFMKVPTASGQLLNAYMIKPKNFDPDKKYPLFMFVYGGPESQNVIDSWNRRAPWFQMLAQEGYIVACVDNRGTNGRGEDFRKSTYMELGKLETIDQVESATYLGDLPYIDESRIGMFGWSYGGFMTSLCLTKGGGLFKMGIAVAPVTNWRFYDTVYTERFMRTPQENPSGYDDNSPINFADQLEGKLLLVHGMGDDNVHFQNSVDFTEALVQANKQFDMQFYPNKNHGIYGGNTTYHLYNRMTNYILENL